MVQRANRGEPLKATGYYTPRDCGLVSPAFSIGAQIADTTVDLETGMVRVNKMFTVHDCGTELNPMAVEGQLEGSIQMSLGYARQNPRAPYAQVTCPEIRHRTPSAGPADREL